LLKSTANTFCVEFPTWAKTSFVQVQHVVLQLAEPYLDKGYNITADNFFTQLPLVLFLQERKTSYVGTIRCNRRELPQHALHVTKKPLYTSHFHTEDHGVLLTSYKAKKNKNVLLLSTRHAVGSVSSNLVKRKPNTVLFYNDTKYGVDILDKMCKSMSVKSGVRRWPLAVFFNLLDIAAINAHILYNKALGTTISRRKYLKMLVEELIGTERRLWSYYLWNHSPCNPTKEGNARIVVTRHSICAHSVQSLFVAAVL
jgi:hypothetical protein